VTADPTGPHGSTAASDGGPPPGSTGNVVEPAWDGSFAATTAEQRRRWAEETTPAERLAWLERALVFAHEAGAIPDRSRDASSSSS
jgi:hypothetical protein